MQFKINIDKRDFVPTTPADQMLDATTVDIAELRRRMYERIAKGNALAHIEENAQRRWQE